MRQQRTVWGSVILAILTWAIITNIPEPAVAAAQTSPIRGGLPGRGAQPDPPPLETDLILLTVTVANKAGAVTGLGKDRFQVLEDGVEQKIAYFWIDSRPLSVGFIMDGSSLMNDLMNEAIRGAGPAFLKSKRPEDEYFVIVFSDNPTMTVSYTLDAKLMSRVFPQTGEEPLYDAIYTGIDAMKEAANPRKALLVITAGGDNGKGTNDEQLLNFALKQPVQVYSMDMGGANPVANALELLAGVTGGRASMTGASSFLVEAMCNELALALKTQYLIGYKSTNTETNGHRRGVKVKVSSPEGSPKLTVWTQSGYYGPKAPKTRTTVAGGK
jgi:Ca-activated chloride channel family protein